MLVQVSNMSVSRCIGYIMVRSGLDIVTKPISHNRDGCTIHDVHGGKGVTHDVSCYPRQIALGNESFKGLPEIPAVVTSATGHIWSDHEWLVGIVVVRLQEVRVAFTVVYHSGFLVFRLEGCCLAHFDQAGSPEPVWNGFDDLSLAQAQKKPRHEDEFDVTTITSVDQLLSLLLGAEGDASRSLPALHLELVEWVDGDLSSLMKPSAEALQSSHVSDHGFLRAVLIPEMLLPALQFELGDLRDGDIAGPSLESAQGVQRALSTSEGVILGFEVALNFSFQPQALNRSNCLAEVLDGCESLTQIRGAECNSLRSDAVYLRRLVVVVVASPFKSFDSHGALFMEHSRFKCDTFPRKTDTFAGVKPWPHLQNNDSSVRRCIFDDRRFYQGLRPCFGFMEQFYGALGYRAPSRSHEGIVQSSRKGASV